MFCYKCGNKCEESNGSCMRCGAKVLMEQDGIFVHHFLPPQMATEVPCPPSSLMSHIPEHFRNEALAQSACAGSAQAQYQIARKYLNRLEGFPDSSTEFFLWLDKAAHGGCAEAQSMLGSLKVIGEQIKQDANDGIHWLLKAADQGEPGAMSCLYSIYKNGIENIQPQDMKKAFVYLERLAEIGHLESCNILGFHYFEGYMVPKDQNKAFELWRIAAQRGHPESQKNISKCYEDGIGTTKNPQAARQYLMLSADNGEVDAISCLGYRLMDGTNGFPKDIELAKRYLYKIVNISPEGYVQYASCLLKSSNIQDRAEGLRMLEEKAKEGNGEANFILSNCYTEGEGVPPDFLKSLSYLQKAANCGHPLALEVLEKMNMKKEPGSAQYKYNEPPKKASLFSRLRKKM